MNERIKELEKQCWNHQTWQLDAAKFAELIIKDCLSIVENLPSGYIDYRNQIEDAFRRDCVEKMKRHFGVEE